MIPPICSVSPFGGIVARLPRVLDPSTLSETETWRSRKRDKRRTYRRQWPNPHGCAAHDDCISHTLPPACWRLGDAGKRTRRCRPAALGGRIRRGTRTQSKPLRELAFLRPCSVVAEMCSVSRHGDSGLPYHQPLPLMVSHRRISSSPTSKTTFMRDWKSLFSWVSLLA